MIITIFKAEQHATREKESQPCLCASQESFSVETATISKRGGHRENAIIDSLRVEKKYNGVGHSFIHDTRTANTKTNHNRESWCDSVGGVASGWKNEGCLYEPTYSRKQARWEKVRMR